MKVKIFIVCAFFGLILFACSCSISTTFNLAPEEISGITKGKIIVTLKDGSSIKLHNFQIKDNKLVGVQDNLKTAEVDATSIAKVTYKITDIGLVFTFGAAAGIEALLAVGAATAPSPPPAGSCPFIYSFDGQSYSLDAEPFGGAICPGLKRAEWCELQYLRSAGGRYRLLISNQLDETQYTDELQLLVVDHSPEASVAAETDGKVRTYGSLLSPSSAIDHSGRDVASLLAEDDNLAWQPSDREGGGETAESLKDDLILEFPKPRTAKVCKLLVRASATPWGSEFAKTFLSLYGTDLGSWYAEVNRRGPAYYRLISWFAEEELYLLKLLVQTPRGWESRGLIYGAGPFVSEKKVYALDVNDIPGETLRIRLRPPLNFWRIDYIAASFDDDSAFTRQELNPLRAIDQAGRDVRQDLAADDDRYFVMPHIGDSAELLFDVPPPIPGKARTVFLKAAGYYHIHLNPQGKPQADLLAKIYSMPGTTLQLARKEYRRKFADSK